MKKLLILTFILSLAVMASAVDPRGAWIELSAAPDNILNYVNSAYTENDADFTLSVVNSAQPATTISTTTHLGLFISVFAMDIVGGEAWAYCDQQIWPANWAEGSTLTFTLIYLPTGDSITYNLTVEAGVGDMFQAVFMGLDPWNVRDILDQTLTIASDPTGQPIWVNGGDTGFVTPHDFLNPVEADVYTINNPAYTWAPPNYTVPDPAVTETITFIGTPVVIPDTYTLTVTSTPTGMEIFKGGVTTGFTTEHTFGPTETEADLFGVYTLEEADQFFHWVPEEYNVVDIYTPGKASGLRSSGASKDLYNLSIDFRQVATVYDVDIVVNPATATINGNPQPYSVSGTAAELLAMSFDIVAAGYYGIEDYVLAVADILDGQADITLDPIPTYTVEFNVTPAEATINGNPQPYSVTGTSDELLGMEFTIAAAGYITEVYTLVAEDLIDLEIIVDLEPEVVPVTLTFSLNPPIAGVTVYLNGNPIGSTDLNGQFEYTGNPEDLVGTYSFMGGGYDWDDVVVTAPPTGDQEYPVPGEDQVPVELSAFTATLTGQFYVQLAWTSQTETQMVGYRVYRNTTADQSTSEMIDNPLIPATNTSTTQNYTVVDADVLINQTYYYWLEAVDYNSSEFHGPVSVTVTGNVPPVLPEVTEMRNAYPNPFKANGSTNIEVSLKAGDTGTLTIYNVQGQLVKTVSLTEGNHMVNWNGRDSRGNACGSGIYFYKLSTQSMNQTKKMVIVK